MTTNNEWKDKWANPATLTHEEIDQLLTQAKKEERERILDEITRRTDGGEFLNDVLISLTLNKEE